MRKAEKVLFYCVFISSISIAASAYVGLNGGNNWRLSDTYAHILGFSKDSDISVLTNFFGQRTMYDVPIYEALVALLADITNTGILPTIRFFNIFLWVILATVGFKLLESIQKNSGKYFVFLLTTSPLFIHYFSAPLPDNLAGVLSISGLYLASKNEQTFGIRILVVILFGMAALIKSPVPFVFLTFYVIHAFLKNGATFLFSKFNATLFSLTLLFALAAEFTRKVFLERASPSAFFCTGPAMVFRLARAEIEQ